MVTEHPALFGLANSNKDFSIEESWGKNQFNNCFPAALLCYMKSKQIPAVYISADDELKTAHSKVDFSDIVGINPTSTDVFFSFESLFSTYEPFSIGRLPRTDLVVNKRIGGGLVPLSAFEIKLTAVPDNQTSADNEEDYGSEIVVRPDTIVYLSMCLANSIMSIRDEASGILRDAGREVSDWSSAREVASHLRDICKSLDSLLKKAVPEQMPFLLQPVWKTKGKTLFLEENCLDFFVWSNVAFSRLFMDIARSNSDAEGISRHSRSAIWLFRLLSYQLLEGRVNYRRIIDDSTFDTKNDKAFAVGGNVTNKYMRCPELRMPRIRKDEIKNIILGGGDRLLSPERRFDAALLMTPGLFRR